MRDLRPGVASGHKRRGRKTDPLYRARRTLHTGVGLLTDTQRERLTALFTPDAHAEVEAALGAYQRMIAANGTRTAPPGVS